MCQFGIASTSRKRFVIVDRNFQPAPHTKAREYIVRKTRTSTEPGQLTSLFWGLILRTATQSPEITGQRLTMHRAASHHLNQGNTTDYATRSCKNARTIVINLSGSSCAIECALSANTSKRTSGIWSAINRDCEGGQIQSSAPVRTNVGQPI